MSSMTFGQKTFTPTPPDKGSFPLDHEGECKKFMLKYMICLRQNDSENYKCRQQSKDYLECRMEKGLMAKEEWSKLGFSDLVSSSTSSVWPHLIQIKIFRKNDLDTYLYKMLRALYAYKGSHARTLAFCANDKFLEIGTSKDPNWVHVISEKGNLGYVPKNYVSLDQVPPLDMLEIIDSCIEGIHLAASERNGNYSKFEHEALQVLVEKRQEWHSKVPPSMHPSKRPAPPPPNRTTSQLSVDSIGSNFSDGSLPSPSQPPPSEAPTPIQATTPTPFSPPASKSLYKAIIRPLQRQSSEIETTTSFIGRGNSLATEEGNAELEEFRASVLKNSDPSSQPNSEPNSIDVEEMLNEIPKNYCRQLVEEIRSSTNISYATSQQVVTLILQSLGNTFPTLSPLAKQILHDSKSMDENSSLVNEWTSSSDGRKLVDVLENLRQCKDDGQQRSWALHEDEYTITSLLNELLDVLTNGDLEICTHVLMLEDHRPLLTLVQYYQMETRWSLRKLLLQVFTTTCQISRKNISYLSSSVLPLELTREILDSESSQEKLQYTVLVLGMILSMGDVLPFTHFSIMNESLVNILVEGIEIYNSDPDTEPLGEIYMTLLLAFNLQFHDGAQSGGTLPEVNSVEKGATNRMENSIIKVLSRRSEYKYLIEKLLILFNREEDPVCIFDHEPRPPHSVLRIIVDIFQCEDTAQLLYTNDEKVLCDIILRQLTDLPPEDKRRKEYLYLLEGVVTLGRWKEHKHRQKELTARLRAISNQDESSGDKQLAERILLEAI